MKPSRYLDSNTSVSYSLLQPVGSIHYPPGADPFFVPPPPPLAEVGPNLMESWPLVGGMEAGGVELAGSADLGRQMLQAPPPYVALPLSQAEGEGMEGLEGMGEMEEGPESEEESESGDGEDPAAQLYYCTSDAAAFGALKAGLAMPGQAVNQSEEEERPPRPPPTKRKSVYKTWSGVTRGAGTGSGKRKPRRRTPTQVQLPLGPPCPMEPSITTQAQRKAANVRERKRMYNLNAAFDYLRSAVPKFAYEKHLSRIETLKLAMHYICFMEELLQTPAEAAQAKYANAANEMIVKWNANVN